MVALDPDPKALARARKKAAREALAIQFDQVVVADATIVARTDEGDGLINSNVAIELGYALHACTDERVVLVFNKKYGKYEDLPFDLRHKGGAVVFDLAPISDRVMLRRVAQVST